MMSNAAELNGVWIASVINTARFKQQFNLKLATSALRL